MESGENLSGTNAVEGFRSDLDPLEYLGLAGIVTADLDGGFETDLAVTDSEAVSGSKLCFLDRIAIEEGTVRGFEVENSPTLIPMK